MLELFSLKLNIFFNFLCSLNICFNPLETVLNQWHVYFYFLCAVFGCYSDPYWSCKSLKPQNVNKGFFQKNQKLVKPLLPLRCCGFFSSDPVQFCLECNEQVLVFLLSLYNLLLKLYFFLLFSHGACVCPKIFHLVCLTFNLVCLTVLCS